MKGLRLLSLYNTSNLLNICNGKVSSTTRKQLTQINSHNKVLNRSFSTSLIYHQNDQNQGTPSPTPVTKEHVLTKKMAKTVVAERGYFDTHAFVGILLQNGFTQQQAESMCHLFKDIVNYISEDIKKECVTRPGQDLAIQQVMIHIGSLKKDMIILEKSEFSALRQENEKLVMELKALKEQLHDEIIKLKGGFTLDINLEKNRSSENSYLMNNQIHQISSRIDTEISNVKAILEQFKAETVKYIAEGGGSTPFKPTCRLFVSEANYLNLSSAKQDRIGRPEYSFGNLNALDELSDNLRTNLFTNTNLNDTKIAPVLPQESRNLYNILDYYYKIVFDQIIQYQSPTTGLFPIFSKSNEIGHVRDTIYCATCVWALRQCYCKVDTDKGRTYHLGQIAVKAMRGILFCWMRQSQNLEKYKENQLVKNALHSKFNIKTGDEIGDDKYGNLQIDCVSLYLITLAQMTSSGLLLIFSIDEVNFVQNLVFYVERAYRTPDYGMFERGTKYNNNECELNSSSIGMAKAALESMKGFNLYGDNGCSWSVVYVDIDAHNRNRTTLETLLPRESSSKNTSASLLPTIGFPAFSIHDQSLIQKSLSKCIKRLKGNYGFKRFLRDGANHLLENQGKSFYQASEVKNFDGVENEYPIFFIFMAINSICANNLSEARVYYDLITTLIRQTPQNCSVVPYYYYVPKEFIELERSNPNSQERLPSNEILEDSSHLWTQSLWIICQLLVEKCLLVQELDPLRRVLQPSERPRQSKRYSSFKISNRSGFYTDLTVQICCIAESVRLQQMLLNYGIVAQTPHQIEPIEIWPPGELVKAYEQLGLNSKLKLTGRPSRPVGVLGTSKLYRICSQTVLCYPLTFEINDFYMSSDLTLLLDDVRNDLEFLSKCWKLQGRPIYIFLIREQNLRGPHRNDLLELLSQMKQGKVNEVPVRMERLQTLIPTACLEHLDFLDEDSTVMDFLALKELETDNSQYKSLSDLPKLMSSYEATAAKPEDFLNLKLNELISLLQTCTNRSEKCLILYELYKRYGLKMQIEDQKLEALFAQLSAEATNSQDWKTIRFCTSILNKTVDSLAPSITNILVRGKIVTLGVFGKKEVDITKPLAPDKIKEILYEQIFPHDINQAVLMQELIINISKYISTSPEMFNGIMKLRLGWIVQVMKQELESSKITDPDSDDEPLNIYAMSPNQIKQLLHFILTCNNNQERTIYQKRQLDGALNRVPSSFYEQAWYILNKSPFGIKIYDHLLPQQPTLSDMTDYELNFSIKVEEMLSKIDEPVFRQICIEMFVIIYTILCRNPELKFNQVIEVDKLVNQAIELYSKENNLPKTSPLAFYNEKSSINSGTSAYLSRVCIEHLLKTPISGMAALKGLNDASCKLS